MRVPSEESEPQDARVPGGPDAGRWPRTVLRLASGPPFLYKVSNGERTFEMKIAEVKKLDEDKDNDVLKFVQNPDQSPEAMLLEISAQGRRMGAKITQLDNKIESLREDVKRASRRIQHVS